jgi:hypothetical protein
VEVACETPGEAKQNRELLKGNSAGPKVTMRTAGEQNFWQLAAKMTTGIGQADPGLIPIGLYRRRRIATLQRAVDAKIINR